MSEQDMPKAVLAASFFDHFHNLKFPAEQSQKIASSEIVPIGFLGDTPVSSAAAEKGEFWTGGNDVPAAAVTVDADYVFAG
jgi:hypothetical protein